MSRRGDRARDRSRKAVTAQTPLPEESPLPPLDEVSFEGVPFDELLERADRDIYAETAAAQGSDPLGLVPAPEHNHFTRAIKPVGQCPGCDEYHALEAGRR